MKKLLFGFLFLIVGFIAAVLAAPNFINWNEYRDVITDEINAATGFNLEIRGDIKISILPSLALLINKIFFNLETLPSYERSSRHNASVF
ncbi:MAG TPA: AsmA family protein [Rhodospirillales bacterium]|nr:AsmA family protein [Rhodospirillales bacterium]